MKLKNIELDSRSAGLAPMAGVADRAFRELCSSYGANYTCSEMVSAKGFTMGDRKSASLLTLSEANHPVAIQIFGSDPDIMATAAKNALAYKPDIIDINMGCPAPKIAGNGGGSALLKDLPLAERIIESVAKAVEIPVTVKFRVGYERNDNVAVELAKRAENAGAAAITIHGRTKAQMYAPPVDIQTIADVKKAVSIPVIGNGDIVDGISAAKMIEQTGVDFLLVGRGALGRPWVFSQIEAYLKHEVILPEPPIAERMLVMIRHIERICELKGERVGIKEARKHAAWYIKGIRGAANYRKEVGTLESLDDLKKTAYKLTIENQ